MHDVKNNLSTVAYPVHTTTGRVVDVAPGETVALAVDPESPQIAGAMLAGVLSCKPHKKAAGAAPAARQTRKGDSPSPATPAPLDSATSDGDKD